MKGSDRAGGDMDDPGTRSRCLDCRAPLTDPAFFTDVDLLAGSDQADDDAPVWYSFRELDEVLGFGLSWCRARVLGRDLCGVERALRLVEDQDVFGRDASRRGGVLLDVVLDAANECLAATAGGAKLVLQDFDQGTVARQVHRGSRRLG